MSSNPGMPWVAGHWPLKSVRRAPTQEGTSETARGK